MAVGVNVRHERVLIPGTRTLGGLKQDAAVAPIEHPEAKFIAIDNFGRSVSLKIEHRRSGSIGTAVLDYGLPFQRAIGFEYSIPRRPSDSDLRLAVTIEIGDGRGTTIAAARNRHGAPLDGHVVVEEPH